MALVLALISLVAAVVIHINYKRDCEPSDSFGKFAIATVAFLCFQFAMNLTASCVTVTVGKSVRKRSEDLVNKIVKLHEESAQEVLMENRNNISEDGITVQAYPTTITSTHLLQDVKNYGTNDGPFNKTAAMGAQIRRRGLLQAELDIHFAHERSDDNGTDISVTVPNYERPEKRMRSLLNELRLDDFVYKHDKKTMKSFRDTRWGVLINSWIGLEIISISPIIFFIILGSDNVDYKPVVPYSKWCYASYAFNWSVIGFVLLHILGRVTPILARVIYLIFKERSRKPVTSYTNYQRLPVKNQEV